MNYCKTLAFLLPLYFIWAVSQRSTAAASLIQARQNLAQEGDKSNPKPIQKASPSPSPVPAVEKSKSGDGKVGANPAEETCDPNFKNCHDDIKNVTACRLANTGDAPDGLFVLVHNDGESSVKLNVTILPVNSTHDITDILGHQAKKIKLSSNASGSLSIVLNAADWTCIIKRVRIPQGFPSYLPYVKPINGAYLLLATALLIGVLWAYCKLGRDERHNGVPYQELEMGQQGSGSSNYVGTLEGWDESWDDDWDEEKAVKSPGRNHVANRRANGVSSRSADTNDLGNDME